MTSPLEYDIYRLGDDDSCFTFMDICDSNNSQQNKTPAISYGQHHQRQQMSDDENQMKETEDLLAAELTKLSVQERAKALDDLHCVGEELQETPEMIQQSLAEFDRYLVQNPSANTRIYSIAVNQNRSYVEDSDFRLKFLRAKHHDARQAVHQMMNFLQQKAFYFGEDNVARDITPSDFNEDDMELMRSGTWQIMEGRDRNGRVMIYNTATRLPSHCKTETMIRVMYHVFYNLLSSIPEVQRKGVILIYYDESRYGDNPQLPGMDFHRSIQHFKEILPVTFSSIHFCLRSSPGTLEVHNRILKTGLKIMSQYSKARARLHYGSDLERQYQLRSHGIPLDKLPVDRDCNVRTEIHNAWCNRCLETQNTAQKQEDDDSAAAIGIEGEVLETDVLFGRGKSVQYHPGNVQYREFLASHIETFENLPRNQRRKACVEYTKELVAIGVRFLKDNGNDVWVECDFEEALRKVLQFYRTSRRSRK